MISKEGRKFESSDFTELDQLIEELNIQHIELEMQNQELRETQILLQTEKQKFFDLYNFAPVSYFVLDQYAKITDINFTALTLLCTTKEKVLQHSFYQYVAKESEIKFHDYYQRVLDKKNIKQLPYTEIEIIDHEHNRLIVSINARRIENQVTHSSICLLSLVDVTNWRNAEKISRKNEENYRLLAENVDDVIWITNGNSHKLSYISPSVINLLGYLPEELLDMNLNNIVQSSNFDNILRNKGIKDPHSLSHKPELHYTELLHKNKSTVWVETKTTRISDISGSNTQIIGVWRDVSLRKQTEDALRLSEEKYKALFEAIPLGISVANKDGKLEETNIM